MLLEGWIWKLFNIFFNKEIVISKSENLQNTQITQDFIASQKITQDFIISYYMEEE